LFFTIFWGFLFWYGSATMDRKILNGMRVLELYQNGVIEYLYQKGLLSGSTLSYIEYYKKYLEHRALGRGYRESVRHLTKEFGVSETTIKKAIKIMNN
jgi:hypothetical protein